ncbi:hypothetical protein [Microbispora hainanensis]|uniref:Uncharacterized protein n=1 Tax=Microbispora hainanensis TaxID=568844 RepID=A0A544YQK2_9ACTN|nr:hypothetical protein [Microbispora hainanensis]TQS19061.1 hypothetical protein FLX08_22045 [Microbispora hainanensis]
MTEPDPTPAAGPREAAEELSRQWAATSERAFSAGLHQPDIYLRTTRLAGAVAEELRRRGRGIGSLLDAWREHGDLVRRVARSSESLTAEGLDIEAIAGAAFTIRYREVLEEVTCDDRLAALAAAPTDTRWVVLEESGYRPGDPFVPYRRLEADARTGRALLVTTRPDDAFTGCVHVVEQGFIDIDTGRLTAGDPARDVHEARSAAEREALVERLRPSLEGDATG